MGDRPNAQRHATAVELAATNFAERLEWRGVKFHRLVLHSLFVASPSPTPPPTPPLAAAAEPTDHSPPPPPSSSPSTSAAAVTPPTSPSSPSSCPSSPPPATPIGDGEWCAAPDVARRLVAAHGVIGVVTTLDPFIDELRPVLPDTESVWVCGDSLLHWPVHGGSAPRVKPRTREFDDALDSLCRRPQPPFRTQLRRLFGDANVVGRRATITVCVPEDAGGGGTDNETKSSGRDGQRSSPAGGGGADSKSSGHKQLVARLLSASRALVDASQDGYCARCWSLACHCRTLRGDKGGRGDNDDGGGGGGGGASKGIDVGNGKRRCPVTTATTTTTTTTTPTKPAEVVTADANPFERLPTSVVAHVFGYMHALDHALTLETSAAMCRIGTSCRDASPRQLELFVSPQHRQQDGSFYAQNWPAPHLNPTRLQLESSTLRQDRAYSPQLWSRVAHMSAIESLDTRRLGSCYFPDAPMSSPPPPPMPMPPLVPPTVTTTTTATATAVTHENASAAAAAAAVATLVVVASATDLSESQPDVSEFSRLGSALRSLTTLRIGDPPPDPRLSFSAFTRLCRFSAFTLYVHHLAQLPASLTSLRVNDQFLSLTTGPGVAASDDGVALALSLLVERTLDLVELRVPMVPIVTALLDNSRLRLGERLQRLECGRQRYTRVHNNLNYSMARADALLDVRRLTVHGITDRRALATLVDAPAPRLERLTLDVHSVSRLFSMPGVTTTAAVAKIPTVSSTAADIDTADSVATVTRLHPARPNLRKFILCAPRSVCADALRRIDAPHLTAIHLEMAAALLPPTAEEKTREVLWATLARAAEATSAATATAFSVAAANLGFSDWPSSAVVAARGTAAEFASIAGFARLETLKLNFAHAPVSMSLADWLSPAAPLAALTHLELVRHGSELDASALDEHIVPRLRVLYLRGRVVGLCGSRLPQLVHLAAFNLNSNFRDIDRADGKAAAVVAPTDPGWVETFPRLELLTLPRKPWCHVATRMPEFARLLARLRARGVAIAYAAS